MKHTFTARLQREDKERPINESPTQGAVIFTGDNYEKILIYINSLDLSSGLACLLYRDGLLIREFDRLSTPR